MMLVALTPLLSVDPTQVLSVKGFAEFDFIAIYISGYTEPLIIKTDAGKILDSYAAILNEINAALAGGRKSWDPAKFYKKACQRCGKAFTSNLDFNTLELCDRPECNPPAKSPE